MARPIVPEDKKRRPTSISLTPANLHLLNLLAQRDGVNRSTVVNRLISNAMLEEEGAQISHPHSGTPLTRTFHELSWHRLDSTSQRITRPKVTITVVTCNPHMANSCMNHACVSARQLLKKEGCL